MPHPPPEAERAAGQQIRKHLPRSHHAAWNSKLRPIPALQVLHTALAGRTADLMPIRFDRMTASPFGFFRGAVPILAADLAQQPHTGIFTQLCGDAHVLNLGAFEGTGGTLLFDINDFDETIPGPFEWDVKRLSTSILLAGQESGASDRLCRTAALTFLHRYRKSIHLFAEMPVLTLARYQIHRKTELEAVSDIFSKAERSTPLHNLDTLTETAEQHRIFQSRPPLLTRLSSARSAAVQASLKPYRHTLEPQRRHFLSSYRTLDAAFKVVGTGSIGLDSFCLYLQGNGEADPLFLQFKQEVASAWQPYLAAKPDTHNGRRVLEGQRAMQLQSDPFLGYTHIPQKSGPDRQYLVRQLNDHKASIDLTHVDPGTLTHYADLCGELLARGHARAGSPRAISGYLGHNGRFDKAILAFAQAYAHQTEQDCKALKRQHHL